MVGTPHLTEILLETMGKEIMPLLLREAYVIVGDFPLPN